MSVRLTWSGAESLDEGIRTMLLGPGGPFEMATEEVLGVEMPVFVQRPRNLMQLLATAADRFDDQRYLVFPERTFTFGNVYSAIAAAAARLRDDHGVERGDRVAIAAANVAEYAITHWATVSLGAVTVALNGWWTTPEMDYGIGLTDPKVVFADPRRAERLTGPVATGYPTVVFDGQWWGDEPAGLALPQVDFTEDDPYLILFTSGTTGRPKGAVISHRANIHFNWSAMLGGAVHALSTGAPASSDQPCVISASPMFHVAGMTAQLMIAPASGMAIVYPPPGRWDETVHLELTQQHRVTAWSLVPTQLWRLLEHPELDRFDLSSLASVGGGSTVWPPEILRRTREVLPHVATNLRTGYGMTETTGLGTSLGPPLSHTYPDSVGVAGPGVEVEVRDPVTGEAVGEGVIAEVCIRTAGRLLEYWRNPEATAAALDADGWYRTGDYGRIRDGVLFLDGRRSDLIIRGGENIYPVEIENRLADHPGIAEAAVIGVEHATLGQEVKAVVVRRDPALTAEQVMGFVGEALARFKVPTVVEFVDELPRNAMGKVLKQLLVAPEQPQPFEAE